MALWETSGTIEAFMRLVFLWGIDSKNGKTAPARTKLRADPELLKAALRDIQYPINDVFASMRVLRGLPFLPLFLAEHVKSGFTHYDDPYILLTKHIDKLASFEHCMRR
jgi:hypothetical protein